ncbi:uncharacterized protein B0H18DRAFT_1116280 [Fomitopsis serialis]|uniref:uncharacterized protein n=1 Tax=Fomitopsis serialis TaxID=139415 RepID=UPI0020080380|nr:uncharacterized protein B0H18DRAFT_1116280 [Neoantrodia serialis]KAH9931475.1 hypothetical protein B0H18DRAFT_1116280 [Neoantrodia serialis]
MTGSTVSLEPLSSPSPSPPPPEETRSASGSNNGGPAALDSGSELSELTEEEQEENSKAEVRNSSRPRDSKRKRSNLLPPPMWDWAYKNNKKTEKGDWRTRLVEEEEEEEQSGPAKAMEEEEDDEQDRSNDDDDPDRAVPHEVESDGEDEREDDDDEPPAHASDAEALEPLPDDPLENEDATDEEDVDEDDAELDGAVSRSNSRAASHKGAPSPELTDDENADDEEAGDDPVEDDAPVPESDAEDEPRASAALEPATPLDAPPPVLDDENAALMDVDQIVPPPPLVAPTPHTAAASSIMAGSTVVAPPSRSPSTSSSASGSPSSSRSPSPDADADAPSDREPEPEHDVKGSRPSRKRRTRARGRKTRAEAAADRDLDADGDADQAAGADGEDGDVGDVEEADLDSPELEMELESDLQPAHRAEALDVLATIELKFALLRERLYVEKMEALAWEEALVAEGTHPEMLHLNEELLKRRDKRLELASRRRDFEVLNVMKRRKLDEDGVWSWWKAERDDLQTEMISETNRKRRKLERERRALERPLPERRIPEPPQEARAPPTLREIVKSYPFGVASSGQAPRHKDRVSPGPLAYPQLSALPLTDVARDLEFLFQHRRGAGGFDPHRQMMNPALGAPVPQFDYPMNMAMVNGPSASNRFGPGQPGFQHPHYPEMQPPPGMHGFQPQAPRPAHHPSAVPGSLPNLHPSQAIDQDMHRPGSGPAQSSMHMQQFGGMAPMSGPGGLMRPRSISPVPVQTVPNRMVPSPAPPGFSQSKSNGWVGSGPPGPSMLGLGGKDPKRPGSVADGRDVEMERERFVEVQKTREKMERDRDLGREREREQERGYPMQMMPQRHAGHQHSHSHVHAPPGQPPHVHVVQHHHRIGPHHHHVVHHHHTSQANGPGGAGQGPPMSALPSGIGTTSSVANSPRPPRDIEPRHIHPSASMEVDMAAGPSRQHLLSPPHMSVDGSRERGRQIIPAPVGPHERLMTPFTLGPSQGMQASFPGSPRNGVPPPTAPVSVGPSRRSSFTTNEDNGLPRPGSSASTSKSSQGLGQGSSHRQAIARRPQTPPPPQSRPNTWSSPTRSGPMDYGNSRSPPHTNGGPAPHMSPSGLGSGFVGSMRSPTRTGQPPLGMQLPPPPSLSASARSPPVGAEGAGPSKNGSPSLKTYGRPPSPGLPKALPGPARHMGLSNPESVGMGGLRTSPAGPLFPPPSQSNSNQSLPSRIPNGSMPDIHPSGGPVAPKIVPVPVDGS